MFTAMQFGNVVTRGVGVLVLPHRSGSTLLGHHQSCLHH